MESHRSVSTIRSAGVVSLLLAMLLVACATPTEIVPFRHEFNSQRGVFAPTRVTVNRNVPVSPRYLDRLDAVVRALAASGAFEAFGDDVESRTVLDLTLERLTDDSFSSLSAGGGGRSASAGVAVPLTGGRHTHRLTAVVYRDGQSTHAYRYVGDFESEWRLSRDVRLPPRGSEDSLISNLVNRLVRDLDRDDAVERIPTMNSDGAGRVPQSTSPGAVSQMIAGAFLGRLEPVAGTIQSPRLARARIDRGAPAWTMQFGRPPDPT